MQEWESLPNVLCGYTNMGKFTLLNVLCGVVQGCESLLYSTVKCCLCRDARMGKIILSYCVVQDQERLYYSQLLTFIF